MSIVSFRNAGRYGNWLFECAATYGYARRHNLEWSVPTRTHNQFWQPVYYTHFANPKFVEGREDILINELWNREQHYQEIEFREEWMGKQIVLNGYWQSEKYFKEFRQEILDLFGFNNTFRKEGYAAIFVRRGDYLLNPDKHPPVSMQYIQDSMDYISQMSGVNKFIVCSDDIPWCMQNIKSEKYHIEFSTGLPFHLEMLYMSSCDHVVSANSTFSWWSGWVNQNPNKIVIAPKDWFGPGNGMLNTKDVCPETWIRL